MGAPINLGGGLFEINQHPQVCAAPRFKPSTRRGESAGLVVAYDIAVALRNSGYRVSTPKRCKGDDVKLRCVLGEGRDISLNLVTEHVGNIWKFILVAFGYTKKHSPEIYGALADEWKKLSVIIDQVITTGFAAEPVKWLSGKEVDARFSMMS